MNRIYFINTFQEHRKTHLSYDFHTKSGLNVYHQILLLFIRSISQLVKILGFNNRPQTLDTTDYSPKSTL